MTSTADLELRERLQSAIWYTVGKIVDEECLQLDTNASPQYIAALTQLVYSQAVMLAGDLESFAQKTVNTDDVLMMCRRNLGLKEVIEEYISNLEIEKANTKKRR